MTSLPQLPTSHRQAVFGLLLFSTLFPTLFLSGCGDDDKDRSSPGQTSHGGNDGAEGGASGVAVPNCAADNGGCGDPAVVRCEEADGEAPTCRDLAVLPSVGQRPDAPAYAVHGPHWVGFRKLSLRRDGRTDPMEVKLWYPARNPERRPEAITYNIQLKYEAWAALTPPQIHGHALQDAEVDNTQGPYPVVLFSHGFAINPEWYAPVVEHLASQGFVVLAPEHDESDWFAAAESLFERPRDLVATLDFAAKLTSPSGAYAGLMALDQVAVMGHSFGGYTALALAGAQFDLAPFEERCAALPEADPKGFLCAPFVGQAEAMAADAGLSSPPRDLWPSQGDARVKAVVSIAGDAYLYNQRGLAGIRVPILAMGGTKDWGTPWELGAGLTYAHVSSEEKVLVGLEGAEHMIATALCEDMPWTAGLPAEQRNIFCLDAVWDKRRALNLLNHYATAFLRSSVQGDELAGAVLAPASPQPGGILLEMPQQ